MITLDTSSRATDKTWGNLHSTVWTTIEADTGIICACLPMLKTPLATLFPRLFPRGKYANGSDGSGSIRHVHGIAFPRKPTSAYDDWGKLKETGAYPVDTRMSGSTIEGNMPPGKISRNDSSNGGLGMHGEDVPLGQITKTTHVNIQYGDDRCFPGYNANDNQHSRTVSDLVHPAFVC